MFDTTKLMRGAAAAALAGALAAGATSTAQAQSFAPVVGCDAPGNKQMGGALIGALLGGAAGAAIAKNDGAGAAVGALGGAAVGSTVGCNMQRTDARASYGYQPGYAQQGYAPRNATYVSRGYRLSSAIAPANYIRDGGAFVAGTTVNLRAAPTTASGRVGQLRAGQPFEALAQVRGTDWILVGERGVGVGYVHSAYVRPQRAYSYAAY